MQGRRPSIPKLTADEVPGGLCWYELEQHLGIKRNTAKLWCFHTGYKPVDGRSKYTARAMSLRVRKHSDEEYRRVLEAGSQTKTLEDLGAELGITRERVRQLYGIYGIERKQRPHDAVRNPELIAKLQGAVQQHGSLSEIAHAVGVSKSIVQKLVKQLGLPFKSKTQRLREAELSTGKRTCCRCGTPKPLNEFYKDSASGRLRRKLECKLCWNLYCRDRRALRGAPVRKDRIGYWEEIRKAQIHGRIRRARDTQPRVTAKQAMAQVRRIEYAKNSITISTDNQLGLTAEQINKLKQSKNL